MDLDQQIKNNNRNGGLIGAESRGRKVVVDNTVKICNSCKRAWEDVNCGINQLDLLFIH